MHMENAVIKCIATGLYSGYMKPYPGTWGTIPAWLIAYFLIGDNPALMAVAVVLTFGVSVWSSGVAEKELGHDARKIVIDEWHGMFVSLLFVPFSPATYAMAFFAFRAYDVIKLPPAAQFEKLPGGWGITMDDMVAGIQANVTIQVIVFVAQRYFDYSFV
jgi:phosphatidylglycerophosphatase A